jgi:predicted acetyltransferase
MNITLERATDETRPILHRFFLQFFYALSEYDPYIYINDFGLPFYKPTNPPLPGEGPRTFDEAVRVNFWVRGECEQYLIRANGLPAGYVIVADRMPHMPPGVDYEILDFYIAPPYRRAGVGRRAAQLAFGLHSGEWIVYQLQKNEPAKAFWRAVIGEYTNENYDESESDYDVSQQFGN